MEIGYLKVAAGASVLALLFIVYLIKHVLSKPQGTVPNGTALGCRAAGRKGFSCAANTSGLRDSLWSLRRFLP